VFGDGKRRGRGRRLPGRAAGFVAALLAPLAPALLNPVTVHASPPVEVLSHSTWSEVLNGVSILHVIGQVRNDSTTDNAGDVRVNFDVLSGGVKVGNSFALSSVRILAPGEISPFEDVFFPSSSPVTTSIVDGSPATATSALSQPYHSANNTPLSLTVTPCADPNPLSDACQNHISGTVQNIGTVAIGGPVTADDVRVIFTFLDGSGTMLGQDTAMVAKADGTTVLAPGDTGSFALDRTGEPAWSGDTTTGLTAIAEPSYPLDVNPIPLAFGKQRVGVASVPLPVALINLGQVKINISNLTTTGDFSVVHPCTAIEVAQSCIVTLAFTPSGMGDATGTLVVADDAPGTAEVVPLTGTGIAPVFSLQPSSLTFAGQTVSTTSGAQDVTLANTGTDVLKVNGIGATGDFSQVHPGCGSTLAAGGSCTISVSFTPTAGNVRNGVLSVVSDALNSSPGVTLSGTGVGPSVTFDPTSLAFGDVAAGGTSSKDVSLTNTGFATDATNGDLTVSAISTTAGFSETDTCGTLPATLSAAPADGSSCLITVTFAPTNGGPATGSLTVRDGSGLDHVVPLTGNGLGPGMTLSATTLDFGGALVGRTSQAQTVTLTSTGGAALTVSTIGPPSSSDYAERDTCGRAPAAISSCTISVTFSPTASGLRRATLSIVDNAGNHQIALTGTGLNGGWETFGGILSSGPGVSSWSSSRLDVFVRGQDSALWHQSLSGTTWSGWQYMGGIITSDPAAVSWGANRIDVMARGQDNALWHQSFDGTNWSGWQYLGGILSSGPAVSSRGPGQLDVFVQGQDHQLWHQSFSNGAWSGWGPLGGIITSDPAAASWGANRIDVFARGQDKALWHKSFDGNAWSGWDSQGGIVTFSAEVTSWGTGRLDVLVIGQDRQLWHKAFDNGTWAGWQPLGGILTASPGAAARAVRVIDVFGRGQDRALWHRIVSG
jgi:hypothetical protein